jgi:hypothetical protein
MSVVIAPWPCPQLSGAHVDLAKKEKTRCSAGSCKTTNAYPFSPGCLEICYTKKQIWIAISEKIPFKSTAYTIPNRKNETIHFGLHIS